MKRNVTAIMLCFALLLTMFTGCSNTSGDTPSPEVSKEADSDTGDAVSESGKVTENSGDVPTIRIANGRKGSDDLAVWPVDYIKKMEEALGIKVELVELSSDQFDLTLASSSASFDLCSVPSYKEQQVLDAKMAVNLEDYLEEYGPDISKYEDRNNLAREFLSGGTGNLYFKRIQTGLELAGTDVWYGYVVRWDWYAELGYPRIDNDDDFLDVLEQMIKAHPANDAGGTTYGLGNYVGAGLWSWTIVKQAQLGYFDYLPGMEVSMTNNEIYNSYTDDEASFWQAMEFFNKAYNKGLMDPDSFIMKSDDITQKVVQGTYAGAIRTWDVGDYYNQEREKDPDTLKGYLSIPSNSNSGAWLRSNAIAGWEGNSWFVYTGSNNIEKAVMVLNYMDNEDNQREFYSGVEGVHWSYENGVPGLTEEGVKLFTNGGDPLNQAGINGSEVGNILGYLMGSSGASYHSDGGTFDLTLAGDVIYETLNPLYQNYSDYYGVDYPAQAHENMVTDLSDYSTKRNKDITLVTGSNVPADMSRINTQIRSLLESYIPDLVTAATWEDFNAVKSAAIAECEKAGSEELFDWAKETYVEGSNILDAAKAKYGIE